MHADMNLKRYSDMALPNDRFASLVPAFREQKQTIPLQFGYSSNFETNHQVMLEEQRTPLPSSTTINTQMNNQVIHGDQNLVFVPNSGFRTQLNPGLSNPMNPGLLHPVMHNDQYTRRNVGTREVHTNMVGNNGINYGCLSNVNEAQPYVMGGNGLGSDNGSNGVGNVVMSAGFGGPIYSQNPYQGFGGFSMGTGENQTSFSQTVLNRRHRKMIKNRESAARSRARRKAYCIQQELEVEMFKEENEYLKKVLKVMNITFELERKKRLVDTLNLFLTRELNSVYDEPAMKEKHAKKQVNGLISSNLALDLQKSRVQEAKFKSKKY